MPFEDGFAGVFRVDDRTRTMNLHAGHSVDGVDWKLEHEPIAWHPADARVPEIAALFHRVIGTLVRLALR